MKNTSAMKKVWTLVKHRRVQVFLSFLFAAVSVVTSLYIPVLFGDAIDQILSAGNVHFDEIYAYLGKILVLIAVSALSSWAMTLVNNRLTYRITQDLRSKAIRQIEVLPMSYLDSHSTGDILGRIIADTDQLGEGLLMGSNQLFSGILTIAVTIGFMFMKSWKISVLVILLTPLSFFTAKFIASRSYKMFKLQNETRGHQTAYIEEIIGNAKTVKAFGYENRSFEKFTAVNRELKEYSRKAVFFSSLTNPCTRAVNSVIYAAVALFGSLLVLTEGFTVGGLMVMLSYANQYMKPFNDISSVITEFQNALACADRVFEFLEAKPEPPEKDGVLTSAEGNIQLDRISFRYVPERPLIEDFSLDVKDGNHIAIVGPTGCGKTTLINLLMRFYDVNQGTVSVNGKDIRDITRHSLRSMYGMVLQDTWLKNATVRDNLRFGKPDAADEELIEAAKRAHSWEFIRRLPGKLDAVVSDDRLSHGQKQLLCITRVMVAVPPILILDEATSSIDTLTEIKIQEAFDELMKGRTSFIVAHRLSTIQNADLILVMKDGKIIEKGNHEELLRKKGFYHKLYNSQFSKTA